MFDIEETGRKLIAVLSWNQVPAGLERAVGSMVKGEKSTLYISKPYITAGSATANLPLEADELEFEVEMIQIIQVYSCSKVSKNELDRSAFVH